MSGNSDQERTEEPTARRRQEAADEGRVPRSAELATAALFLGGALTFQMVSPAVASRTTALFGDGLRAIGSIDGPADAIARIRDNGFAVIVIIAMIGLAIGGMAIALGVLQARGTFASDPLKPQFNRLNPIENAQRLFGWRSVADLVKALAKVALVGLVTWRVLSKAWPDLLDLGGRDAASLLETVRHNGVRLLASAGGAFLALAGADYGFQWWQHVRSLRMTKDEVRQEMKQQDGDPLLKSRIRAIARSRIRRQMFKDVAKADVVIVNPTHIAIALRYDPLAAPAPVVLAMGERKIAERIKQIAREKGIPTIENRPLARALIATARVGLVIPAELYAAVAEVLAFVYRERARRGDAPAWSGSVVS
ncbi:MAG TPA: EscU/YscU/HrcU family type III secretion system export apparatus switch protein [Gemmatimonadaceae bacterium]|nr:EscU/YscU/HrcU family type III secretion system export apparatus switch protein [Gemmatimonadaceae bacterium]